MEFVFEVDQVTLQILVACAVSLEPGPARIAPMEAQLQAIKRYPEIGNPCQNSPELAGCRLLRGDTTSAVYTVDTRAHRIRLLAMAKRASRAGMMAATARSLASARRGYRLTALTVSSVHNAPLHAPEREGASDAATKTARVSAATALRREVETHLLSKIDQERRVTPEHEPGRPPELCRFPWRSSLSALWLRVPDLWLAITIGTAPENDAQALEALEARGTSELNSVQSVLAAFSAPEY